MLSKQQLTSESGMRIGVKTVVKREASPFISRMESSPLSTFMTKQGAVVRLDHCPRRSAENRYPKKLFLAVPMHRCTRRCFPHEDDQKVDLHMTIVAPIVDQENSLEVNVSTKSLLKLSCISEGDFGDAKHHEQLNIQEFLGNKEFSIVQLFVTARNDAKSMANTFMVKGVVDIPAHTSKRPKRSYV